MSILTLEIANGITNQRPVHDQHKLAKKYHPDVNKTKEATVIAPHYEALKAHLLG